MSDAQWWDNPGQNDGSPVIAHTPDETKYHYPGQDQTSHMRGGIGSGVIIPRANNDGTSKGFDGGYAGVVHVDPDAPDGGAVVDLSQMDPHTYHNAFRNSQFPHEVFYRLSAEPAHTKIAAAPPPMPMPMPTVRVNPMVPSNSYIAPASSADGTQLPERPVMQTMPLPPVPMARPAQSQPVFATQTAPVAPAAAAPQYIAPPLAPSQDMQQLTYMMGQLMQVVGGLAQNQQPAPPVPPMAPARTLPQEPAPVAYAPRPVIQSEPGTRPIPRRPAPLPEYDDEPPRRQSLREVAEAAETDPREGMVIGFESLEMPWVTGPLPLKPKKEVFFDIPGAGKMKARYHEVIDGGECLVFVFDTRYEDGMQYLPPDLKNTDDRITVTQPKAKKTWVCMPFTYHFACGVNDFVIMLIDKEHVDNDMDDDEDDD